MIVLVLVVLVVLALAVRVGAVPRSPFPPATPACAALRSFLGRLVDELRPSRIVCRLRGRHAAGGAFKPSGRFLDRKGYRRVELLECRFCGAPAVPSRTPGPIPGARRTVGGRR